MDQMCKLRFNYYIKVRDFAFHAPKPDLDQPIIYHDSNNYTVD